jgi:hypothetical protein
MNFINPEQFSIISEITGISTEKRETVSVAESNSGGIVPPACFLILVRLPIIFGWGRAL